ncbi:Asn synthase domain containing protein [Trichuris trichiura]|uniref:Asn synthase domain containing protein n=1 Tax=Trichuris trichiura TaxID=36087 RepID=A0A077Z6R2_TRITR|nr:Asn synthase domain containing protein [Trichuris trichiura]
MDEETIVEDAKCGCLQEQLTTTSRDCRSKENCLWFGRDCFGRKSLLLYDSIAQEPHLDEQGRLLILSTLNPVGLPGNSLEVPVGTLHCLKLSGMTYSIFQLFSSTPLAATGCLSGISPSEITKYKDFNELFSVNKTSRNGSKEGESRMRDAKDLIKHFIKENKEEIEKLIAFLRRSITCQLKVLPHQFVPIRKSPETTGATISVLFSGGIDSLLVAALLGTVLPAGIEVDLLNVAFTVDESHNCSSAVPDRQTGIKGYMALKARCSHVHWNLLLVDVTRKELYDPSVQSHVRRLMRPALTVRDESIAYAIWFASKGRGIRYETVSLTDGKDRIHSSARVLFLGSGADELFAGYMRHRSSFAEGGYNALAVTLEEELFRIGHRSLSLCDRVISDHRLLVLLPYLHESFVRYVNSIPLGVKTDLSLARGLGDKLILRAALWLLGYEELCFSLKRAIQFGSRIVKVSGSKGKGEHLAFT